MRSVVFSDVTRLKPIFRIQTLQTQWIILTLLWTRRHILLQWIVLCRLLVLTHSHVVVDRGVVLCMTSVVISIHLCTFISLWYLQLLLTLLLTMLHLLLHLLHLLSLCLLSVWVHYEVNVVDHDSLLVIKEVYFYVVSGVLKELVLLYCFFFCWNFLVFGYLRRMMFVMFLHLRLGLLITFLAVILKGLLFNLRLRLNTKTIQKKIYTNI